MSSTVWGVIEGVEIAFPMTVHGTSQATLMFTVPRAAATPLIPGDAFEVVEVAPGQASFVMALVDYTDNPWGDYNEVGLGVLVHPKGRPEVVNAFVYRMPVDQEFTTKAGTQVMGLPKTVEDVTVERSDGSVTFALASGGVEALSVTIPLPDSSSAENRELDEIETVTYSYLDGIAQELPLRMQMPPHMVDPAAVTIRVGGGPVGDELTRLGLPSTPDLCLWGENLSATFDAPRPM